MMEDEQVVKKFLEELEIKSDLLNLCYCDLVDKYGSGSLTYRKFVKVLARDFLNKSLYSLIVSDKYYDIERLIRDVNFSEIYTSFNDEATAQLLLLEIEKNKSLVKSDYENVAQSAYILNESLGVIKYKDEDLSFPGLFQEMSNCAKALMYSCIISPEYDREEPSMQYAKLYNNKYFLYLANYIAKLYPNLYTPKLTGMVKDIINSSICMPQSEVPLDYDEKKYCKLARKTLKNISQVEKKSQKRDRDLKKCKTFFTKPKK